MGDWDGRSLMFWAGDPMVGQVLSVRAWTGRISNFGAARVPRVGPGDGRLFGLSAFPTDSASAASDPDPVAAII